MKKPPSGHQTKSFSIVGPLWASEGKQVWGDYKRVTEKMRGKRGHQNAGSRKPPPITLPKVGKE